MNDNLLKLYQHSPYPLRSLAASVRGFQLRSWRYGPQTEQMVAEALEREDWSRDQWRKWQEERIAYLLDRAVRKVPFYAQLWSQRRMRGDRSSWELLENWPVLKKETLRQNPVAFLADDCHKNAMFRDHTSGTTGTPLELWCSRSTVQSWYALYEARARRWFNVSRGDRWGMLGGQLVTATDHDKPPFWVWNYGLNQLYFSSYHLSQKNIGAYLKALRKYNLQYLLGYSSSLDALASGILSMGEEYTGLKVIVTNAEPLYENQKTHMESAFKCPVRETYGMAELTAAASECPHGSMHVWPETGYIEILAPDHQQNLPRGENGNLVCTGLINADMPLIRYEVGDWGALMADEKTCSCGRNLPILASIEGRIDDILYTWDGRRIGRLDPIFKQTIPLREAQITQQELDEITLRYVPAQGFSEQTRLTIIEALQTRMGKVHVRFEEVEAIPRQSNGKFKAVICQLPDEVIKKLELADNHH